MACPRLRSATSQAPLLVAASLIFWAIVRVLQVYYAGWGSGFDVGIYRTYAQLWGAGGAPYVDFQPEYPPGALPVFLFPYLVGGVEHYPNYFALSMAVFDVIAMLLVLFQVRGECTARTTEAVERKWTALPQWVFCSWEGTLLDESNTRKAMRRVLREAGLPQHFTPHCLRHTYASLMLQQGESVAYVQRQLGHASIQLTVDTYGKWLPMGNKAAVDRLDSIPSHESGSKTVATGRGEDTKSWSWREELNLQPAVYKNQPKQFRQSRKPLINPTKLLMGTGSSGLRLLHLVVLGVR